MHAMHAERGKRWKWRHTDNSHNPRSVRAPSSLPLSTLPLLPPHFQVADLPRLWREKMVSYLGVAPPDDAQGVLQDVHWSSGVFGYFPTYSLGAAYASQLFAAAKADLPALDADIAAGRFAPLREWLNEKVHRVGSLHPSGDELMRAATGAQLRPEVFLGYLTEKYSKLYKLKKI